MSLTMYWYPNCSTCKKAKKWLEEHNIEFNLVHIVEETPSKEELKELINNSGLEPKKFFNTSGKVYREQNMKEKLPQVTLDEMLSYLAADGMLIKRSIVTDGERVTGGCKEGTLESTWRSKPIEVNVNEHETRRRTTCKGTYTG